MKHIKNQKESAHRSSRKSIVILQHDKVFDPQKEKTSLKSQYLSRPMGMFYIWAYVSDIHHQIKPQPQNRYLISYATNSGLVSKNPATAKYLNAWAILRVCPSDRNPNGIWRFWSNGVAKDYNYIDYNEILSSGWHLFSVFWWGKRNIWVGNKTKKFSSN